MKIQKKPFAFLAAAIAALAVPGARAETLKEGDPVPKVTAPDDAGNPIDLADAASKGWTLFYFYPKADTPGCTKQGCNLRDNHADLTAKGVRVFGISADTVEAQKKFKDKFSFPFTLIADKDGKVIDAFGVEKLPMGFSKRVSFLAKDGKIVWRDLKPKPEEQSAAVLSAIASIGK
ncbi:MAG: peroxiredoxin [Verrucomicrobiae bacterium]|nr:peroxiredoxin [Verrucomicrobiae bacterium]